MPGRRLAALFAFALLAGSIAWALVGLPGAPAACLPAGCDCEAPGPGPIRQPVNAWSSLALVAAGIVVLMTSPVAAGEGRGHATAGLAGQAASISPPARPPGILHRLALTRSLAGGALFLAGLGAFLYHAGLTAWGARADGIGVAILLGGLALHGWARWDRFHHSAGAAAPPAGPGGWGRRDDRGIGPGLVRSLAPWCLLALGGLCWWLGGNDGPWCRPDSRWQAHAAWHLLAAAAIGLWLRAGRPEGHYPPPTPPGL